MAEEKVYTPEVVEENPFPGGESVVQTTPATTAGTFAPSTTEEKALPSKRQATELLSTALNTRSRKVLGEFELAQSGGFRVGTYQEGISGEVALTPGGLAARNRAGIQTFVLDGETGDAVFAGQIQTGSVIAGRVLVGDGSIELNGDNTQILIYVGDIANILLGIF